MRRQLLSQALSSGGLGKSLRSLAGSRAILMNVHIADLHASNFNIH